MRVSTLAQLVLAALGVSGVGMQAEALPDFSASENVFFLPHIGKDYGGNASIFDKRVCVVGASHYARGYEDCLRGNGREVWRMMTRNTVRDYLDSEFRAETRWKATYTKFINAFFDTPTGTDERRRFFDSVVFFNYLQQPEGEDGNESHPELYADERHFKAFCEIISATKPDVVIVWGGKVRGALFRKLAPTEKDFVSENRIRAEVGGHEFLLIAVRHPSQAFPQEKYREIFRECGLSPR